MKHLPTSHIPLFLSSAMHFALHWNALIFNSFGPKIAVNCVLSYKTHLFSKVYALDKMLCALKHLPASNMPLYLWFVMYILSHWNALIFIQIHWSIMGFRPKIVMYIKLSSPYIFWRHILSRCDIARLGIWPILLQSSASIYPYVILREKGVIDI